MARMRWMWSSGSAVAMWTRTSDTDAHLGWMLTWGGLRKGGPTMAGARLGVKRIVRVPSRHHEDVRAQAGPVARADADRGYHPGLPDGPDDPRHGRRPVDRHRGAGR